MIRRFFFTANVAQGTSRFFDFILLQSHPKSRAWATMLEGRFRFKKKRVLPGRQQGF